MVYSTTYELKRKFIMMKQMIIHRYPEKTSVLNTIEINFHYCQINGKRKRVHFRNGHIDPAFDVDDVLTQYILFELLYKQNPQEKLHAIAELALHGGDENHDVFFKETSLLVLEKMSQYAEHFKLLKKIYLSFKSFLNEQELEKTNIFSWLFGINHPIKDISRVIYLIENLYVPLKEITPIVAWLECDTLNQKQFNMVFDELLNYTTLIHNELLFKKENDFFYIAEEINNAIIFKKMTMEQMKQLFKGRLDVENLPDIDIDGELDAVEIPEHLAPFIYSFNNKECAFHYLRYQFQTEAILYMDDVLTGRAKLFAIQTDEAYECATLIYYPSNKKYHLISYHPQLVKHLDILVKELLKYI